MKRTIAVLLITMLCACGVTTPPEAKTSNRSTDSKWVGITVDELIIEHGEPINVYTLEGGGRMFEYLKPKKAMPRNQSLLSAKAKKVAEIRAKRKVSSSDQSQDCVVLFQISASDIVESWSTESGECK